MTENGRKSFDDVRSPRGGHGHGCPRCGAERNGGQVLIRLCELNAQGQQGRRVNSRGKSLCESCSVEVYELLLALFTAETKRHEATA